MNGNLSASASFHQDITLHIQVVFDFVEKEGVSPQMGWQIVRSIACGRREGLCTVVAKAGEIFLMFCPGSAMTGHGRQKIAYCYLWSRKRRAWMRIACVCVNSCKSFPEHLENPSAEADSAQAFPPPAYNEALKICQPICELTPKGNFIKHFNQFFSPDLFCVILCYRLSFSYFALMRARKKGYNIRD